jgi:hypothetical protein
MEYLTAHPSSKINYRRGTILIDLLSGYADADWGNTSSSRSTSGMVMLYNKSPMMWKSKMQKTMHPLIQCGATSPLPVLGTIS